MKLKYLSLLAICAVTASACATKPYVPTIYDAEMTKISSIAIAEDSIPEKLAANELQTHTGTAQAAGGLIGFAIASAMEGAETSSRVSKLTEIMEPTGFDPEAEFEKMLSEKLEAAGYENISMVGGERPKKAPLKTFPETTADAILDVSMTNFGMQKARTGEEWRPAAGVNVQLVSSADNSVLMENIISYNSGHLTAPAEGTILLSPSSDSKGYMKVKEMEADVVVEGMRSMIDEISTTIVELLE